MDFVEPHSPKLAFIVVNYRTWSHVISCVESIVKHSDNSIIVVVDNSDMEIDAKVASVLRELNVSVIACKNIGYGQAINKGLHHISSVLIEKKLVVHACNADVVFKHVDRYDAREGSLRFYVPRLRSKNRNTKSKFMNMLNRRFTISISRFYYQRVGWVFGVVAALQKVILAMPSRVYTTHGCIFIFDFFPSTRNSLVFNENTFLYSEELEFGEYMLKNGFSAVDCHTTVAHEGSVSISKIYSSSEKRALFFASLTNWRKRWFL